MVATTSSSASLIIVFGSTGAQGGSVVRHLIASVKEYRIRCVTRDLEKAAAKDLGNEGCEVVQFDLGSGSDEEMAEVFKGAKFVFGITTTDFNPVDGYEKELNQGKRIVNACSTEGVKMLYWSGIPNVSKLSGGKFVNVKAFDVKAHIYDYAVEKGVPSVDIQPGSFMSNYINPMMGPRKISDKYVLARPVAPSSSICLINTERDFGAFVVAAIEQNVPSGTEIFAYSDEVTMLELMETWSKGTGRDGSFVEVEASQFTAQVGSGLSEMFQWMGEFGYYGTSDPSEGNQIRDGLRLQSWEQYIMQADWSKIVQ